MRPCDGCHCLCKRPSGVEKMCRLQMTNGSAPLDCKTKPISTGQWIQPITFTESVCLRVFAVSGFNQPAWQFHLRSQVFDLQRQWAPNASKREVVELFWLVGKEMKRIMWPPFALQIDLSYACKIYDKNEAKKGAYPHIRGQLVQKRDLLSVQTTNLRPGARQTAERS